MLAMGALSRGREMQMPANFQNLKWLWLSLVVALIDTAAKRLAEGSLPVGGSLEVLPFLNFALGYNAGVSFGLLGGGGGWQRWPLVVLTTLIALALVGWLARLRPTGEVGMKAALALVIGGAAGNIIDRVQHGAVTDFLQLHYSGWYWPTFNPADVGITLGAILLIATGAFTRTPDQHGHPRLGGSDP